MIRAIIWATALLHLGAAALSAQTVLTPNNREVEINSSRIAEANFPDHQAFLLFRPDVDYSQLRALPVIKRPKDALDEKIQGWYDAGTAAGNVGDFYENRDHGHSHLNLNRFYQFAKLVYSEELVKLGVDFGVKVKIVNERPTIVNASLAMQTEPYARSMARLILHNPQISSELYTMYRLSNMCFYPEHNDHDPKHGDLFALNTPYLIISQGSSGSDRPFMQAVAYTLASFRPAVKEQLIQRGLLAPTVQMILRWSNAGVGNAENYLTGAAHPTVFDAAKLNPDAMAEMAHNMQLATLPPLAMLKVTEETIPVSGVDYFDADVGEKLIDTPCAIGRIVRSTAYSRTFRVSAADSIDVHNRPLNYHWVVLRGDPEKIKIEPLNPSMNEAEITIDYHPETTTPDSLKSHRVDIGVFVDNGVYYSAPSFISVWYAPNEIREYDEQGRIEKATYQKLSEIGMPADAVLLFDKPWTDTYEYDGDELTGWYRDYDNGDGENFNAAGKIVESGWFSETKEKPVSYEIASGEAGYRKIETK